MGAEEMSAIDSLASGSSFRGARLLGAESECAESSSSTPSAFGERTPLYASQCCKFLHFD